MAYCLSLAVNTMHCPILYSFRRCPYAIRARLAIAISGVECELREVVLKDKPSAMLDASPKATVPVLVVGDTVIDESIDIAEWALSHNDPQDWLMHSCDHPLIRDADTLFKPQLDRYKYADRYPMYEGNAYTEQDYFDQAYWFLVELEQALVFAPDQTAPFLLTPQISLLDAMIFPFIRQFASVNRARFDGMPLPKLHRWLQYWLNCSLFASIMHKYPRWCDDQTVDDMVLFP